MKTQVVKILRNKLNQGTNKQVIWEADIDDIAEKVVKLFCQPAVMPLCEGNCGMNYCDDNGCIERKRALVEPKDLPEHGV